MQRHRRLVERVRDRLVGLGVVFRRQFRLRALPQRAGRIDLARLALFRLKQDRELDVVGIGADDALDLVGLEIFLRVGFQVQHDLGAARHAPGVFLAGRGDFKSGAAGRRPAPDLVGAGAAAEHLDALGHHEGGIEADAELADQAGAVLGLGQPRQEGFGAGAGDGAEIVDQLLAVHADAGIDHAQRIGRLVGHDADFGRLAVRDQLGVCDRLIAQLVAGVRGVRDQFAQENIGFRIDRMHHQVQQFGDLGLERLGDGGGVGGGGHTRSRSMLACGKGRKNPI